MKEMAQFTVAVAAAALLAACHRPPHLPESPGTSDTTPGALDVPGMELSTAAVVIEAPATGEPAPQTIVVVNAGRGTLARPSVETAYLDAEGWLTVTVSGEDAPYAVSVQAITAPLPAGTYRATLTLTCANTTSSPIQVPVTLTVPSPRYALSTAAVAFEASVAGDPEPQTLQVANGGRGALPDPDVAVSYIGTAGWLTATMTGTSAPYTVTLSAREVAAMPSGVHTAILTVGSAELGGRRQAVDVRFTLRPQLVISGTLTPFSPAPGDTGALTQTLTVKNVGRGILPPPTVTATRGGEWLSATVTGSADPYTIVVAADGYRALAAADYAGVLAVSAPGAPSAATADVALHVAPPVMVASGNVGWSVYAGCPLPGAETVTVTNTGVGALPTPKVTIPAEAASWLRADVAGSTAPYAVRFTVTGAPPATVGGAASTVAVIEATGAAPVQVPVSFAALVPAITGTHATPSPLVIHAQAGTGDAPGILTVRTDGGCIPAPRVSYAYGPADPDWLSWTVSTAVQQHDVALQASTAGMSPGSKRELDLYVSSSRPGEAPVYAEHVALTLENAMIEPTGALSVARVGHALVALRDGRGLVTGGVESSGAIPWGSYSRVVGSAEVYEPASRRFDTYPSLVQARTGHGAVALDDGRVVVCGGQTDSATGATLDVLTCEVSAGGAWTAFATLRHAHHAPTLVPLPGGQLLVVSGNTAVDQAGADPEVIDLTTGVSVAVTGPAGARVRGSSAVTLHDGRVLVAAATTGGAWLYDPTTNAWTGTADMQVKRLAPALFELPDGRVLAVGGLASGEPYVSGSVQTGAELWDPGTGAWTVTGAPTRPFGTGGYGVTFATLANGKVAALDAEARLDFPSSDVEVFDAAAGTWSIVREVSVPNPRLRARAVRLAGGTVLVVGGKTSGGLSVKDAFTW